jgi:hypothetical protein
VVWNEDGTVRSQGLWADNTLVEALIVPTPVPTADSVAEPESGDASADMPGQASPEGTVASDGASGGER